MSPLIKTCKRTLKFCAIRRSWICGIFSHSPCNDCFSDSKLLWGLLHTEAYKIDQMLKSIVFKTGEYGGYFSEVVKSAKFHWKPMVSCPLSIYTSPYHNILSILAVFHNFGWTKGVRRPYHINLRVVCLFNRE